jgi:uncharacterized membrane protein
MAGILATTPDPTAVATTLATNVGGQLVDTVVGVLPVIVPALLSLWALAFVMRKFGLGRKAKV